MKAYFKRVSNSPPGGACSDEIVSLEIGQHEMRKVKTKYE